MKFSYIEVDECISRCITNEVSFSECSAKRILETMGDTSTFVVAKFYPDAITNQQILIRRNVL